MLFACSTGRICVFDPFILASFTADATSQLDILWHDGHTLGVDRAQVGIFEKTNKVGFGGFLKREDRGALEPQVCLKILRNFTDQPLERKFADQKISRFLVSAYLAQRNSPRPVAFGFLDAAIAPLPCIFRRKLLAWGFATGGFTRGLLGA